MSSTAPRSTRACPAAAWARLLLCAALLLGVGAMHTLGHVQEGGHAGGHVVTAAVSTADHPASGPLATDLPDTDPLAVCLAIVALAVALLGVAPAAFSPWPGTPPRARRLLRGPPRSRAFLPPAPSLAHLQVLRV